MILAFGHKARQGKDTAGEAVVDHFMVQRFNGTVSGLKNADIVYPKAEIFKFADELYRICKEEYGMKEKDAPLLQKIGDGRRQEVGLDYWIKKLAIKMASFNGIAVITDMRYTNEAEWVKSSGGLTINVSRLNQDGTPYFAKDRDPNFISEVQLDNWNYDYYIKAKTGDAALVAEQAITIAEYIKSLV